MSGPVDLRKLWREVEDLLKQALLLSGSVLNSQAIEEARHFIDHNEFGLAFSTIVEGLQDTPSDHCQEALRRIAMLMDIEPPTLSN